MTVIMFPIDPIRFQGKNFKGCYRDYKNQCYGFSNNLSVNNNEGDDCTPLMIDDYGD